MKNILRATGCGPFDRQAHHPGGTYGVGNVWADTQFSNYIRSRQQTECNGFTREPGHLQDFDLKGYPELSPKHRAQVSALVDQNGGGVLYRIQHVVPARYPKPAHRLVHGHILTNLQHKPVLMIRDGSPSARKSVSVLSAFWDWLAVEGKAQARRERENRAKYERAKAVVPALQPDN